MTKRKGNATGQGISPTVSAVRALRPMGWGDYKHKLVAADIIKTPQDDVPQEWHEAFRRAFR